MDVSNEQSGTAQSSKQTTERIEALSEISKKIPQILQHAGLAVAALTQRSLPPVDEDASAEETGPLAANKVVFRQSYSAFLTILNEVTTSLNEEADALVEAKLLPEKAPKKDILGDDITNEGMGNLDIGYLNSRTRDVGLVKERELVGELKALLEKYVDKQEAKKEESGETMDET